MEKPSRRLLRQFVAGQLSEQETDEMIAYLSESEETLAEVDAMWAEQDRLGGDGEGPPELDADRSRSIEQRLFRQINRSNLGNKITVMGTVGFLQVAQALLSPFFNSRKPNATTPKE